MERVRWDIPDELLVIRPGEWHCPRCRKLTKGMYWWKDEVKRLGGPEDDGPTMFHQDFCSDLCAVAYALTGQRQ